MSFSLELRTYLAASGISNMSVYVESFPAPKNTTTSIVCILPAGKEVHPRNRSIATLRRRITASGTAASSITKLEEIKEVFIPETQTPYWASDVGFTLTSWSVYGVWEEEEPTLIKNTGNIFIASFVLRFSAAYLN